MELLLHIAILIYFEKQKAAPAFRFRILSEAKKLQLSFVLMHCVFD